MAEQCRAHGAADHAVSQWRVLSGGPVTAAVIWQRPFSSPASQHWYRNATLMVLSHWRIFTDTKKPEAARRLIAKLKTRVDRSFGEITVDNYHKGGHVVTFDIEHEFNDWIAAVYDVISCAQQMGHSWSIGGFIDEELDLIATGTSISGIKMVSCFCPRPGTPNAK